MRTREAISTAVNFGTVVSKLRLLAVVLAAGSGSGLDAPSVIVAARAGATLASPDRSKVIVNNITIVLNSIIQNAPLSIRIFLTIIDRLSDDVGEHGVVGVVEAHGLILLKPCGGFFVLAVFVVGVLRLAQSGEVWVALLIVFVGIVGLDVCRDDVPGAFALTGVVGLLLSLGLRRRLELFPLDFVFS